MESAKGINFITQNNEKRDLAEIEEPNSFEASFPQQNSTINDTNKLINNINNIDENCPKNFLQKKENHQQNKRPKLLIITKKRNKEEKKNQKR